MVLLHFLEEVEPRYHNLLAIEAEAERVRSKSHILDTALVRANEAAEERFVKRQLREHIKLAWVIKSRHKNPLSMVTQVVEGLVADDITKLLKVLPDLVAARTESFLLRDEATSADNDRW